MADITFTKIEEPTSKPLTFTKVEPPSTSLTGVTGGLTRGAAPYATGALLGAAAGAPFAGVGAVPGALAGIGATALTQFGTGIYDWLAEHAGLPHITTPQELTDKALDAIGVSRPATTAERAAESVGSFLGSMAGVRATPAPPAPPSPAQRLLQDFEAQKISPSIPAVGQGGAAGISQKLGQRTPVMGPVIRAGERQQIADTAAAAERRVAEFGTPHDEAAIGSITRNALRRFASDRKQANLDYGEYEKLMASAPPMPLPRTLDILNKLMGRYPSAPGLVGLFTRSPIAKLKSEVEPRTITTPAIVSKVVGPSGQPIVLKPAQSFVKGGTLTTAEIQELRSQVGYQLEHPAFGPDQIPRAQLKMLYKALTRDMYAAAKQHSPEAARALARANARYGIRMALIDRLEPLVTGESSETIARRVNRAAIGGDASLLQQVKKVMSPEEWGDVGASIISHLGQPTPGAMDVLQEVSFSPSSYMTRWNQLSSHAKDLLFGHDLPGTPREALEQLARAAQAQKNIARLANVSHSGEFTVTALLGVEAAKAAFAAILHGQMEPLLGWGAAGGASYAFAKMLMSPKFARWYYQLPKTAVLSKGTVARSAVNLLNALTAPDQDQR